MEKKVFIIGGGPSLENFDFSRLSDVDTIVVNTSVLHVPKPDYFITMDYTWFMKNKISFGGHEGKNQIIYDNTSAKKFFVVSFRGDRREVTDIGVIDKNCGLAYDLRLVDNIIYSSGYGGVGLSFDDFRCGMDSGYSALQLAVVLGYDHIYLLGMDFVVRKNKAIETVVPGSSVRSSPGQASSPAVKKIDLSSQTHFFKTMDKASSGVFSGKLREYLLHYSSIFTEIREKTNCKVFSCSPISLLNQYVEYVDIDELLKNNFCQKQ